MYSHITQYNTIDTIQTNTSISYHIIAPMIAHSNYQTVTIDIILTRMMIQCNVKLYSRSVTLIWITGAELVQYSCSWSSIIITLFPLYILLLSCFPPFMLYINTRWQWYSSKCTRSTHMPACTTET